MTAARGVCRLDDYLPFVGSVFTESGSRKTLVLAKAEASRHNGRASAFEQFSLRFTPPAGEMIENRVYKLEHPQLGRVELLLTPVGSCISHGETQKGEAIISHARSLA